MWARLRRSIALHASVAGTMLALACPPAWSAATVTGFTPTSGPIGTVITMSGSGFTGFTTAWIGSAHDAPLLVVSDTTLQITVPADAKLGSQSIGIISPTQTLFPPQHFTVLAGNAPTIAFAASPTTVTPGGSATLSWSTTNVTTCVASGGWSGSVATSGTATESPTATTTYTLTCSGANGSIQANATVTVRIPAPTIALAASPASIVSGASSTLSWSTTNAASCTASGGWSGSEATSGSLSVSPSRTTTYTLACTGAGGTSRASATVSVTAAPKPTVTVGANPPSISAGSSSTLTWSSSNATSCVASGAWTGTEPLSGTLVVAPAASATYTLTCSGPGGQGTANAAVTVVSPPPPAVTITANPATINAGSASTLTWTSSNATACTASGGWSGGQSTSGTLSVAPAATTTYALSCTGSGGSAAGSAVVTVIPAGTPTVSLSASPVAILAGASATLTWTSTNSTSCLASGGWSGSQATSGSATVSPTTTTTYTLTCSTATASTTVSVSPAAGIGSVAVAGMPLISRNVPAYASSSKSAAANADDADYATTWRSSGVPSTLTYDLSAVPTAQRQSVLLVWYNDDTYDYDHTLGGGVGYNNAGSYTIQANAAAGGGAVPTSGWVTLASVTGNTKNSLQHLLSFAGYNWIQASFTASDGSSGNTDIDINMDVYDASSITDGWFFGGDSITANCMGHAYASSSSSPAFGAQVNAATGNTPLQVNAGMAGWTSTTWLPYLSTWLTGFHGRFVTLDLGTNDAGGGASPTTFYNNMLTMVEQIESAGMLAVVPTIPYSPEPTHLANIPGLNAQIENLYLNHPTVIPGPDLFSFFQQNPSLIGSDPLHPTTLGCADYRQLWAQQAEGQYAVGTAAPVVSLSLVPASIASGSGATLSWTSTGATSCIAGGSWYGPQSISGSLAVSPAATSYYTLTCTGSGGAGYATVVLPVN